jgi:hypothetical protein
VLAALVVLLPRWRRNRPPPGGTAGGAPSALSDEDSARLDADLARYN